MVFSHRCQSPSTGQEDGTTSSEAPESDNEEYLAAGYVQLGTELICAYDSGSSGSEEDTDDGVVVDQLPSMTADDGDSLSGANLDRMLHDQLSAAELIPRSGFETSFTKVIPDQTHVALWNARNGSSDSRITVNDDKADLIRKCMSNFTLPATAIPLWAKQIPEKLWTERLREKLNASNSPSS